MLLPAGAGHGCHSGSLRETGGLQSCLLIFCPKAICPTITCTGDCELAAGQRPSLSEYEMLMAAASSRACLSPAKLTVAVEPVESELSILAYLDEVAIGISHVAAPFPAV